MRSSILLLRFLLIQMAVAFTAIGSVAMAADYPSGPVKLIVSSGAGNAPDVIGRIVADEFSELADRFSA